jgi:erythronate-4-phosphate dehydrogenase
VLAADVVCCHAPLTFDGVFPSHHMLNAQRLSLLKPNAVLINAGRGGVVSNQALKQLLTERSDLRVVLDVWENEPAIDCELLDLVDIATPHIAGYSYDGKLAGTAMIYHACCEFLAVEAVKRDHVGDEGLAIEVKHIDSVVDGVSEAVLAAYPIQRDNLAMRDALANKGLVERSAAFDQLRKQYPIRREFSRYRISNSSDLIPELLEHLSTLGFMV